MFAAEHPLWLWLALALTALGVAASALYRRRSWRWRLAGVLLPGASCAALALALAGLTVAARPRVVMLLDFSGSTRRSPWRDPAWVHALAQRRLSAGQAVSVVAFAGDQRHVLVPDIMPGEAWPALFDWEPPPAAGTDIAAALGGSGDSRAVCWVITDGLFPAAAVPAEERWAWTIVPVAAPDAAVRDVVLRQAGAGQVEILVLLRVTGIAGVATARVTVERDGAVIADEPVEFSAAPGGSGSGGGGGDAERWFTLKDQPDTAVPHHYAAHIQLPGDAWPENDRGAAIWPGAGVLRTLIVGDQRPANLAGDFVSTDHFTRAAAQLAAEGWQAIVLNDVPAETLPGDARTALAPAAARALDQFVRDNGGGLVLLGSGHAFGPGRYGEGSASGETLEALAPVSSHPRQKGGLGVLFLLDASASMNERAAGANERKIAVAARGVQEAAGYLAEDDELTLVTFSGGARQVARGAAGDVRPALGGALAALEPAGTTNPDAALPQVAEFMQSGSRHLVVLLTDGEIPALDIAQWRALLQAPGAHLAIIAPPPDPGAPGALQRLAAAVPGASWSQTDNPGAWAEALRQAVLAETRGRVESMPLRWTSGTDLFGVAASWTRTWRKAEAVDLAVANDVATTTAASAPTSATAPGGASSVPVAAVAQRGLGKVGAVALADDGSPAYETLRQRVVRAVAASPGDRRFTVSAQRAADGQWLIAADGVEGGKFLDGQNLFVKALGAADGVPMAQTGPGHYEARVPPNSAGLAAVVLRQEGVGGGAGGQLVARVQAAAVETSEWPATVERAALPPEATVLPVGAGPLWNPPSAGAALSPWLWLAAALAALSAVWLRK